MCQGWHREGREGGRDGGGREEGEESFLFVCHR
jgi:hypothetical protein